MIGIVDYGLGNIAAFEVAFRRLGIDTIRIERPEDFARSSHLILPGVGAFDMAMQRLANSGLQADLLVQARSGKPLLGVCVGMQMLADGSEEGVLPGLSLIPGMVRKLPRAVGNHVIRRPHMGWNISHAKCSSPLSNGVSGEKFYFLHSYYFDAADTSSTCFQSLYGAEFSSGVKRGNIYGVQFHPEKSHAAGLQLLSNFAGIAA